MTPEAGGFRNVGFPADDWVMTLVGEPAAVALDTSADVGVRWVAARSLRKFDDPEAVEALAALLADNDFRLRHQAARSLGMIGPAGRPAVPALRRALFDGEGPVRVAAARALGEVGDPSAVPDLVKVAETTGWDTLHAWATYSLVKLGAAEAAEHLTRRLSAGESWQRRWAAGELGKVGGAEALRLLREARSRDHLHRRSYTRAIKSIELRITQA
jgi:HEAT repeat protein